MDIDETIQSSFEPYKRSVHNVIYKKKPLEAIRSELVGQFYSTWLEKRGARRFPSKEAMSPKVLRNCLKHVNLLRVIDDGKDFEFRVMGDAIVQNYGAIFNGRKLSEIDDKGPGLREMLVRDLLGNQAPLLVEIQLEHDAQIISCRETLNVPLSEDGVIIDHVLGISVVVEAAA